MKKIVRTSLFFFLILASVMQARAQKKAKTTTGPKISDSIYVTKNKIEKTQADTDKYIKMTEETKNKIKILFPSKPDDTVYTIIPNISYTDSNLKYFKEQLDAIKGTKSLTSSYRGGNAVIKVIYKGGNASKLYNLLNDQVKEIFPVEEIEGNRAILNYKLAKAGTEKAGNQNH